MALPSPPQPEDAAIEQPTETNPTPLHAAIFRRGWALGQASLKRPKQRPPRRRQGWHMALAAFIAVILALLVYWEARTSTMQSFYFARQTAQVSFKVESGPSDAIRFPQMGPFDERLGYALLPSLIERLTGRGFMITAQARNSPRHMALMQAGIYPLYHEKSQAGLKILDHRRQAVFVARHPQLIYETFEDIPSLIVKTLLFIENRELLDTRYPYRNPTIEWDRLARAVIDWGISRILPDHDVPGGSTLATQIEKYRHSLDGRTATPLDKLIQMASASYRAYLDGRSTLQARQRVVRDYINSVPLGAIPGAGEVRGLGHGLAAWHGASFKEVNNLLKDGTEALDADASAVAAKARAYKEVLSLFLAQRRPAYYLQSNREALKALTDRHLVGLVKAGIISDSFMRAVQEHDLKFRDNNIVFQPERLDFLERKAANAVRVHLLPLFGFDRLYTLDRLDLEVTSTIDYQAQNAVTEILAKLKDKDFAAASGLIGERLLAKGEPSEVIYSFTLRQLVGNASVLRVQADNVDGPFNVSEGGKLELGSTAKLRTLVTYLEVIEKLWTKYERQSVAELAQAEQVIYPQDTLARWVIGWLSSTRDGEGRTLRALLESAMQRTYSASPGEAFFTGGGLHRFSNFAPEDNTKIVTVAQALEKSVNLPFVRMMRDIVNHYIGQIPQAQSILNDADSPERKLYLSRFANKEGRQFLGRFYLKYRDLSQEAKVAQILSQMRLNLRRLAAVYSVLEPTAEAKDLADFLHLHLPQEKLTDKTLTSLYDEMYSGRFRLHDKGFITGLHPLELWLAAYLYRAPKASFSEAMDASANQRQDVYEWLFRATKKSRQDMRIRIMLEQEAFQAIHAQWQKLGFPFASLVPTLATSLGSSGDKPSALSDLMGIILAGGIRYPAARIEELNFAPQTPFATKLKVKHPPGIRVLNPEIAEVLKQALVKVVDIGTAVRVRNAFTAADGTVIPVGGKTGTGDNRYSIFAPGGRMIESKVMSRTATFVFFIGDQFFGTLTAYVPSASAGNYAFTSALPTQILKVLAPRLAPLVTAAQATTAP